MECTDLLGNDCRKSGCIIPIVSYVPLRLSIVQTGDECAKIVCEDWKQAVMQQNLRHKNIGGLERVADWQRVRGGQLQWNPSGGGVTPGEARTRRGGTVATVDPETASLTRDDFLWLERILSPFSRGASMLREWCVKTLTDRIYQHMILHYTDGFDTDGMPFISMHVRLRFMKHTFEAPWRFLYQIKLDGTPMVFVNGKDTLGDMYVMPIMYYDETGYGTYEFFCRPREGKPFTLSPDPSTPAAGLLLNGGAPGSWAWSLIDGSSTYTTRRILPAKQPVPGSLDDAMSFPVVFAKIDDPDPSLDVDPSHRCYDTEYVVP